MLYMEWELDKALLGLWDVFFLRRSVHILLVLLRRPICNGDKYPHPQRPIVCALYVVKAVAAAATYGSDSILRATSGKSSA